MANLSLEILLDAAILERPFGDAQSGQPGGTGAWLVQFVLRFPESSSTGYKSCRCWWQESLVSFVAECVSYFSYSSKCPNLTLFFLLSQFFWSNWVGQTEKETKLSFGVSKQRIIE